MSVIRAFLCVAAAGVLSSSIGAPKELQRTKTAVPRSGVKTPGVLIPFEQLKSEADVPLASPVTGVLFTDQVVVATASGLQRADPRSNKLVAGIAPPQGACGGIEKAFGFLWVPSCKDATLTKSAMAPVATESKKVEPAESASAVPGQASAAQPLSIEVGAAPTAVSAIAASSDSVWLLADSRSALLRIDPAKNAPVAELRLPSGCTALLSAEAALWAACPSEAKLLRIDPRTNLVEKRIDVSAEPVALAAGASSIWVLCRKDGKIARVDPKTNKVTATIDLSLPNADGMLAFGDGSLWASAPGFPLMRIAPAGDKVAQQFYGAGGGRVYFGAGSVWITSADATKLTRFDPKRILATLAE